VTLKQYFKGQPRGSKKAFSKKVKITPTYLGLLLRKAYSPSAKLAKRIEKATGGQVTAKKLRPDLF
jgi:DNA-binding transcriptional regulator YdaS (Cro superfamily)